jgi:hypothetical protein
MRTSREHMLSFLYGKPHLYKRDGRWWYSPTPTADHLNIFAYLWAEEQSLLLEKR